MRIETLKQCLEYLDDLRLSGEINMFGAAPYLDEEMEFDNKHLAREIVKAWMKTYSDTESLDTRSEKAHAILERERL